MRWNGKRTRVGVVEDWFAWYPVSTHSGRLWMWLEVVGRTLCRGDEGYFWSYCPK